MAKKRFSLITVCTGLALVALNPSLSAQDAASESVVVTGEEVPSAYGAPPGFSRAKFSNLTQAYVLPPWAFYFGEIYQGFGLFSPPPPRSVSLPHPRSVACCCLVVGAG